MAEALLDERASAVGLARGRRSDPERKAGEPSRRCPWLQDSHPETQSTTETEANPCRGSSHRTRQAALRSEPVEPAERWLVLLSSVHVLAAQKLKQKPVSLNCFPVDWV